MPQPDSLKRLGGGRWETRDGRFAVEPQSGTWVIVDNEQTDELGLPLVRGPFGSLTAAKEAIEVARAEGPRASPLAGRLGQVRHAESTTPSGPRPPKADAGGAAAPSKPDTPGSSGKPELPLDSPARPESPPKPAKPEAPPEPKWLGDLEPSDQRRARDLIARLRKMGIAGAERIVRAEITDGEPTLARLAVERAVAKAVASANDPSRAVSAAVKAVLRGADVELGVSWSLVDGHGRRIQRLEIDVD